MTVQKAQARQLALVAGGILCFMLTLVGYQMWSLSSTKAAAQDEIHTIQHREHVKMASMGNDFKAHLDHEIHVAHEAAALTGHVLKTMEGIDAVVQKLVNDALPLASESTQRSLLLAKLRPHIVDATARVSRSLKDFEFSMAQSATLAHEREPELTEQMHRNYEDEAELLKEMDGHMDEAMLGEGDAELHKHLEKVFKFASSWFDKHEGQKLDFRKHAMELNEVRALQLEYDMHDNSVNDGGRYQQSVFNRYKRINLAGIQNMPKDADFGGVEGIGSLLEHIVFFANLDALRTSLKEVEPRWRKGELSDMAALDLIMASDHEGGGMMNPLNSFLEELENEHPSAMTGDPQRGY